MILDIINFKIYRFVVIKILLRNKASKVCIAIQLWLVKKINISLLCVNVDIIEFYFTESRLIVVPKFFTFVILKNSCDKKNSWNDK